MKRLLSFLLIFHLFAAPLSAQIATPQTTRDGRHTGFAPAIVHYANLAPVAPASWSSAAGSATVTTGQAAPDGTTGAAKLSSSSFSVDYRRIYDTSRTFAVGDRLFAGVWVKRAAGATGGMKAWPVATLTINDSAYRLTTPSPVAQTYYRQLTASIAADSEWEWLAISARVVTIGSATANLQLTLNCDINRPIVFYAPVLHHVAAGALSETEAETFRANLFPVPDGVAVGTVTVLPAQTTTFSGSGGGDFSSNTTTSVDGEVVLFSGSGGKTGKRATGTGYAKLSSGALSAQSPPFPVADGGTGATSLTGFVQGNGTSALTGITATQATALLDVFTSSLKGVAPASAGGTTNYLRADGNWAAPPGTFSSTGTGLQYGDGLGELSEVTGSSVSSGAITLNPSTTPGTALFLDINTLTSTGQRDSQELRWRARSRNGATHYAMDWKAYIDVVDDVGNNPASNGFTIASSALSGTNPTPSYTARMILTDSQAYLFGTVLAGSSNIAITNSSGNLLASALTGTVAAANGGTGLDTSGSTGGVEISSGTWSVTSFTGTGNHVRATSPTITNASLSLDAPGSFSLSIVPGSTLNTTNRTLTLTTGDASRTITLNGNLSFGGAVTTASTVTIGSSTHTVALTTSNNTSVTLPTSGTLLSDAAAVTVAQGGTGLTSVTANRIPYGSGTSALQTSANLTFDGSILSLTGTLEMNALTALSYTGTLLKAGAGFDSFRILTAAQNFDFDANGNARLGDSSMSTSATNGFLYVRSMAGQPSGTPASFSGLVPLVVDTTNNKLWIYNGSAWKFATLN